MRKLVEISTKSEDPVHADEDWVIESVGKILCPDCKSVMPSWYPNPVDVRLRSLPEVFILNAICWIGVELIHKKFFQQISEYFSDQIIGKCFDSNNNLIKDYVTCYTKKKSCIVVRGTENVKYFICSRCGAITGGPWPGREYLLSYQIRDDNIYQDHSSTLYLKEELVEKLSFANWKDVELIKIPIRQASLNQKYLPCDSQYMISKYPKESWEFFPDRRDVLKKQIHDLKKQSEGYFENPIVGKAFIQAAQKRIEKAQRELDIINSVKIRDSHLLK